MALTYTAPTDAPAHTQRSAPASRRAVFSVLAAFILLGPAPGQLFGLHSMFLREWVMFSAAGIGLLKGHFTLHRADGAVTMRQRQVARQRIYEPADLKAFAARICNDARETARLSFEGSVGTFSGWRPLIADDVCNAPAQAHYGDVLP